MTITTPTYIIPTQYSSPLLYSHTDQNRQKKTPLAQASPTPLLTVTQRQPLPLPRRLPSLSPFFFGLPRIISICTMFPLPPSMSRYAYPLSYSFTFARAPVDPDRRIASAAADMTKRRYFGRVTRVETTPARLIVVAEGGWVDGCFAGLERCFRRRGEAGLRLMGYCRSCCAA